MHDIAYSHSAAFKGDIAALQLAHGEIRSQYEVINEPPANPCMIVISGCPEKTCMREMLCTNRPTEGLQM